MPPVIPLLREEFGLTLFAAGWLSSLVSVMSALAAFGFGAMADRIQPHRVMFIGIACLLLGSMLGLASELYLLFFARILESVGFVVIAVGGPRLLRAALAGAPAGTAFGAWATYLPGGAALAMFLSPWFVSSVGWRGLWILNIALILIVSLPAMVVLSRRLGGMTSSAAADPHRSLTVLRMPALWLLGACFGCYTLQFFAVVTFLPTFLIEDLDYSNHKAALLTAVVVMANTIGTVVGGWLLQRGVPATTQIAATLSLLWLASIGLFASFMPDETRLPAAILLSAIGGVIPGCVLASVNEVIEDISQLAAANGVVVQGSTVGNLLGPPILAGALPVLGGWHNSWVLFFLFAVVGLSATLLLRFILRGHRSDSGPQR